MRWSMLPVSIAAHAVLFTLIVVFPLAGSVEMPAPWQLSTGREFITAAPAPPPQQVEMIRTAAARRDAAPLRSPDHIEEPPDTPTTGREATGVVGGPEVGIPPGISLDAFNTSPVTIVEPPPPPPPAQRAYRPGGAIREPRKVRDAPAVYPELARAARIHGLVILEATIDERGVVTDARVLRSVPPLDGAALTALKQWRYTPTLLNGVPVRVLMTVTFRFSLGDQDL
jgi:periplasmic protein TonB